MAQLDEQKKLAKKLNAEVLNAYETIGGHKDEIELEQFNQLLTSSDLWNDPEKARIINTKQSKLESKLKPWLELINDLKDNIELLEVSDESLEDELTNNLEGLEKKFSTLKNDLKFSGVYDDHDVIVSIHAGAGGTDAQDWADMLLRMYLRWCEKSGIKATLINKSSGEEAGIKSASFSVEGKYAYGRLKGEDGVHRLVRLSPFNADALRQTSFAKVEITPKIDSPSEVEIDDKDLKVDVYRSGGKGGQSVNTTDSAVRVTHLPTGIVVAIQNERSQLQNKEMAMTILRSKLAQLQIEQHAETISELKGPNEQAAWGNQIRNYVLHPYKLVKDLRTQVESTDPEKVLDGDLDLFINAYIEKEWQTPK